MVLKYFEHGTLKRLGHRSWLQRSLVNPYFIQACSKMQDTHWCQTSTVAPAYAWYVLMLAFIICLKRNQLAKTAQVWLGLTSDLGWSGGIQIQPKHWKWPFQLTVSNRNVSRIHSQYFALPMCSDAFQFAKSQLSTSRGLNCRLMARPRSGTRRRSSVQCPWPLEGCPRPWGHGSYSEVMNL